MAKNEFLPFGIASNANVLSNADYLSLPARGSGFQSGVAKSRELNTAWRQSSVIAAVVAQFIADNSGNDVLDDGDMAVVQSSLRTALNKLYLQSSDGSVLPVGTPIPWPTAVPPVGWLKCNGSTFNTSTHPLLALAYPSGVLPDLRGEFIRGWDDGRGADSGRSILSTQGDAIRNITGSVANAYTDGASTYSGVLRWSGSASTTVDKSTGTTVQLRNMDINASLLVPTATENRPRNISFNYIVRAA